MSQADEKRRVGQAAAEFAEAGMTLGLGTGSTAGAFIEAVAARGLDVRCVPTSEATATMAKKLGLKVVGLDAVSEIDLTVDGVDEVDRSLQAVKGGGGALMREKIVASLSRQVVYIGDSSKLVGKLGKFPLPVEVSPFAMPAIKRDMDSLGAETSLRMTSGKPFVSDEGHWILDAAFGELPDPDEMDIFLNMMPGVVAHGLFIELIDRMLIARGDRIEELTPQSQ
jgi:ribose 5-phosphate isomerase A